MRLRFLKPLHGWRAFLGEIGVVVAGVLIALAAQQAVDAWNWQRQIAEETEVLEEEVRNNHVALTARVMMQRCIDRRLTELAEVFRRHAAGEPLGIAGPVGRPTVFSGAKSVLAMATADGTLAHMDLAQKRALYATYSSYDTFVPIAAEERTAWRQLQAIDRPDTLAREDWRDLRKAYDAVVDTNAAMRANLRSDQPGQWLEPFQRYPIRPDEFTILKTGLSTLPYVQKLCRPMLR